MALAGLTVENRGFQEAVDALKRQLLDAESQARKDKDAIARLDKGTDRDPPLAGAHIHPYILY